MQKYDDIPCKGGPLDRKIVNRKSPSGEIYTRLHIKSLGGNYHVYVLDESGGFFFWAGLIPFSNDIVPFKISD